MGLRKAQLHIVIVNWNSGQWLTKCLRSIESADRTDFRISKITVIDNASTDGSADEIECVGLPLTVIHNGENLGFAKACNQGAKGCKADYILFLNPDVILTRDALARAMEFMGQQRNKEIGILGIQLRTEDGHPARSCSRFPSPMSFWAQILGLDKVAPRLFPYHVMKEWDHKENRLVDHVIGAFYLIRWELFQALGGFDESFFVYLEDVDLSLRARKAGHRCFYLAEVWGFHKGGGSSEKVAGKRLSYSLQSKILYGFKHFSKGSAIALLVGTMMVEPLTRFASIILGSSTLSLKDLTEGYKLLWTSLPQLIAASKDAGK